MKHLGFSLTAPAGLLIVFCGLALLIGVDPWPLARSFALSVPIVAYVVLAHFTMMWAMNVGEVGVQPEVNGSGRRYVWHGVPILLCLVLTAAGACIVLVAGHMQRWLGGAV